MDDRQRTGETAAIQVPAELKERVLAFMSKQGGKMYQKIPHPEFDQYPVMYDDTRLEIIAPHLGTLRGRALDIGTNWGRFAHWLEDLGFDVTAVENDATHAFIARGVRDLLGKKFKLIEGSIFDVHDLAYDVVFALNIFHHFLKNEETYFKLLELLQRVECSTFFLQSHHPDENQMKGAFRNMQPMELVELVMSTTHLQHSQCIGHVFRRPIFRLWGHTGE